MICIKFFFLFISFFSSYNLLPYDLSTYDFLETQTYYPIETKPPDCACSAQNSALLPICLASHMIQKFGHLVTAYIIISSGFELKENLNHIQNNSYWPFRWYDKVSSYSHCFFTIGTALLKIYLIRYCTEILIKATCPDELASKHRHRYQTEQVLIIDT